MSNDKAEIRKMRLTVFFIGSFIVAFICATIFLFISAYDDKSSMTTAPLQDNVKKKYDQSSSEKWH